MCGKCDDHIKFQKTHQFGQITMFIKMFSGYSGLILFQPIQSVPKLLVKIDRAYKRPGNEAVLRTNIHVSDLASVWKYVPWQVEKLILFSIVAPFA